MNINDVNLKKIFNSAIKNHKENNFSVAEKLYQQILEIAPSHFDSIFQNNLTELAWTHNLENIFKYFDNYIRIIKNFTDVYPNFIYDLQFEKLVNNPIDESKKLMKFCELPWDKKCLEFYKRKDLISKTASNVQIRQGIYKHSLDKYLPYKKFLEKNGNKYSWFN